MTTNSIETFISGNAGPGSGDARSVGYLARKGCDEYGLSLMSFCFRVYDSGREDKLTGQRCSMQLLKAKTFSVLTPTGR